MKVNQIVNEHKKGVRAHIYNKKATTKAQGTVPLYGPDKQEAKMTPYKAPKAKSVMEADAVAPGTAIGKIEKVDPATKQATIKTPSGEEITQQLDQTSKVDDQTVAMAAPATNPQELVGDNVVAKEGGDGAVAQVNTKVNPPMVLDNATGGSPLGMTNSGEEISPQLVARSTDWTLKSIQANGKTYPALYSGTRGYRVGRQAYQEIMSGGVKEVQSPYPSRNPGTPAADAAAQAAAQAPQKHQSVMPSRNAIQEADNILLDKMLTIAGLR